jgi:hypothetical protein
MFNAVQAIPLIEALVAAGISTAQEIASVWKGKGLMSDEEMNATLEGIAKNADTRAAQAAADEAGTV